MSDMPQGPDWWQGTDGKWYPAHLHPNFRPPPPPPGFRPPPPPPGFRPPPPPPGFREPPATEVRPPAGYWQATDGNWYPPQSDEPAPAVPSSRPSRDRRNPVYKRWWFWVTAVLIVIVVVTITITKRTQSATQSTTTGPVSITVLIGKRIPGASAGWIAIASPESDPVNVAGTSVPPLVTNNGSLGESVSFFQFLTVSQASAFYLQPPAAARLVFPGIQAYQVIADANAAPPPSRWLDLRECLRSGGPGPGGAEGADTPSGGSMDAAGNCSVGTPSSIGFATELQRGNVVVLVQTMGGSPVLGSAGISTTADSTTVSLNTALTTKTLSLMNSLGFH